jgi:large subunit ribosomal protein L15
MASIESVLLFIRSLFRSRQLKKELFQIALFGGKVHDGGQMPLQRRLPKHGFKNFPFKVTYDVINLDRLQEAFEGKSEITLDDIYARGLARLGAPVKVLSRGEVKSAIKVEAHKFSQAAAEKIRNAGGEATELEAAQAAE